MNTMELFAGSCSFSKVAKKLGWNTFTTDWEQYGAIDYVADILEFDYNKIPYDVDVIWASPPCTTFSVASIGHHWTKHRVPKTKEAEIGLEILNKTLKIIESVDPKFWVIENPRGMMRKVPVMDKYNHYLQTPWYCQYGETRAKPTDIWSNIKWVPRSCKNGNPNCHHERAPRGSRTGTQGIKGAHLRSVVPRELCEDICQSILSHGLTSIQTKLNVGVINE